MSTFDWNRYRKCDACGAAIGKPCRSLTGYAANSGSGAVAVVQADSPHGGRTLRVGYARAPRSNDQDGGS